jgi:hypothetical protein
VGSPKSRAGDRRRPSEQQPPEAGLLPLGARRPATTAATPLSLPVCSDGCGGMNASSSSVLTTLRMRSLLARYLLVQRNVLGSFKEVRAWQAGHMGRIRGKRGRHCVGQARWGDGRSFVVSSQGSIEPHSIRGRLTACWRHAPAKPGAAACCPLTSCGGMNLSRLMTASGSAADADAARGMGCARLLGDAARGCRVKQGGFGSKRR